LHKGSFEKADDTEIPQLRDHVMGLTVAGRLASVNAFENGMKKLLTSLTL